jgi:hypothetical protein
VNAFDSENVLVSSRPYNERIWYGASQVCVCRDSIPLWIDTLHTFLLRRLVFSGCKAGVLT